MHIKSYLPFYKRNLAVAIPVILSQLGQIIVVMADTMMVGRLGANELAAVSFAGAITNLGLIFASSCAIGLTPLVGQKSSDTDIRGIARLFQNSFAFNFFIGIIVVGLMLAMTFFFEHLGQDAEVISLSREYYIVVSLSILPVMIFFTFKQFLEGLGNTRIAMVINIISNLLNILLNYVLIYGKFGFPAYGVAGAAYATFISRIIMPFAYLGVFLVQEQWRRFLRVFAWKEFKKEALLQVAKVGMPIGLQILAEQVAFSFTTIMVGWLGAIPLASHQVAMNISFSIFMVLTGLGSATTIRVSHQYGAKSLEDMRKAAHASYHLGLATIALCAIAVILFRHQIPLFFTSDPAVVELSSTLLLMMTLYLIPDALQIISMSALRGISDVKKPMIYASFAYLCINIPVGYLCGFIFNLGAVGIWIGFIFGLTTAATCFILRFEKKSKSLM